MEISNMLFAIITIGISVIAFFLKRTLISVENAVKELTTTVMELNIALKLSKQSQENMEKRFDEKITDLKNSNSKLWERINKIAILIIITIFFSSCSMQKLCEKCPSKITVKDSIITKIIISEKLDSIYIPSDFATFEAWLKCDSLGQVYLSQIKDLQGTKIKVNTIYKDNYIKVDCATDSLLFLIASKDSIIDTLSNNVKVEVVEKRERYVPFWLWFAFGIVIAVVGFVKLK